MRLRSIATPHLLRSTLIVIGSTLTALALCLAIGARNGVERQFDALIQFIGDDLYQIQPGFTLNPQGMPPRPEDRGFTVEEVVALRSCPAIRAVAAMTGRSSSSHPSNPYKLSLVGVTPNYVKVAQLPLASGRTLHDGESGVAIIGEQVAKAFFDGDPVGQILDNNHQGSFLVVGVLEHIEDRWESELNGQLLVPFEDIIGRQSDALRRQEFPPFSHLWLRIDAVWMDEALTAISEVLGSKTAMQSVATLYTMSHLFSSRRRIVRLYELTAVVLLVVGAANVATLGVSAVARERRGIGIRRAIGATAAGTVLRLVGHIEALSMIGTLAGAALALALASRFSELVGLPLASGGLHIAGIGMLLATQAAASAIPAALAGSTTPLQATRRPEGGWSEHPLRGMQWLAILCAVVGVAAVVFVAGFQGSLRAVIYETFAGADPNVVGISPGESRFVSVAVKPYALTLEDAQTIYEVAGVEAITWELYQNRPVSAGEATRTPRVIQLGTLGPAVLPGRMNHGRQPTEPEILNREGVAVIGVEIAREFFGRTDVVGETITIDRIDFEIIGVFEPVPGGVSQSDVDYRVYIPEGTVTNLYQDSYIFWARLSTRHNTQGTIAGIHAALAAEHPDVAPPKIEGPASKQSYLVQTINSFTVSLFRLAVLALLLSSAGLANYYWSQTLCELKTFGVRRAVGASRMRVFLRRVASASLELAIAWIVAFGAAVVGVQFASRSFGAGMRFRPEWALWALAAMLISSSIGIGIPSLLAARTPPATAIRRGSE